MFRKQSRKEDEPISEDLLAAIPDVGQERGASPQVTTRFVPVDAGGAKPGGAASLAQMRQELEVVFARELSHVEQAVANALAQMEAELVKANDQIALLRIENEELQRARDAAAKRLEALRALVMREDAGS